MADSLAWIVPVALAAVGAVVWFVLYARGHGRPALPPPTGLVTTPPYDWTPVQVGLLLNWGELKVRDLIATMADLVARGALLLTAEPVGAQSEETAERFDYIIERAPDYTGSVTESERFLIDGVLFCQPGMEKRASLHEIIREGARHAPATCTQFDRWCELAAKEQMPIPLENTATTRSRSKMMTLGALLLGLAMPPVVGLLFKAGASSVLVLIVTAAMSIFGVSFLLGSRIVHHATDDAAVARALWQAYEKYLAEIPGIAHRPLQDFVLGGRAMIYAITFGLPRSLIEDLRLLYPDWQITGSPWPAR